MKTSSIIIVLALSTAGMLAQDAPSSVGAAQAGIQSPSDYSVAAQDGNSRVWQRTVNELDATGAVLPKKHSYVELQAGVNHLLNGQWVPSSENIEVLPDGSAVATNGQHQAYFPGDIYDGAVTVVMPDQQILQSRPFILCYTDGNGIEIIGELKSSTGEFAAANQVVYPDAFDGIKADIRYTYTKAGFEQDIILRQQPPSPAALGLDPTKTRIEVMTEFFNPPPPELAGGITDATDKIQDTDIHFGTMRMILGKAFSTVDAQQNVVEGATVFKDWIVVQGRTFLVEKLPYQSIAQQLQSLPLQASAAQPANSIKIAMARSASTFSLPPGHSIKPSKQPILLARADYNQLPGVVLDYVLLGSTVGNFTFKADTTYWMNGNYFEIDGLCTFEGGAVIKFTNNAAGFQLHNGGVSCLTGPYRPLILTAQDDNSVGETIAGSTGNPSGYYGSGITLLNGSSVTLHDIRMSYLNVGFNDSAGGKFENFQAINCNTPFIHQFVSLTFNNGLFYNIGNIAVQSQGSGTSVSGTQLTIDNCNTFADSTTPSLTLANCLVTATTNLLAGSNTLTTNKVAILTSNSGIYQTVGAGSHYLANSSPYQGAGTNNINTAVLASLLARTTYPPLIYSNQTFFISTNLQLQAKRDTNSAPDLGYHYDPLDYITDNLIVTNNNTLTLTNGVAVACYNEPGILLRDGSTIISTGTPLFPNWFVRYQSVQDTAVILGGNAISAGQNVSAAPVGTTRPNGTFQFTHFATPANGGFVFNHTGINSFNTLTVLHSELWGGTNDFSGPTNAATVTLLNNLFYRSGITASNVTTTTADLAFTNNLIYGTALLFIKPAGGDWFFFNNDVDSCAVDTRSVITNGYNAFINCTTNLIGTANLVSTNAIAYQSGALGTFYQPTNSPLIDLGNIAATSLALAHFTTLTNQTIESNSVVDIGYHYVALGTNGLPLTDTNGIPFYLSDLNQAPVIQLQPANYTAVLSNGASFTVTASGAAPLKYQWRFNTTTILAGATNTTLTLNNVQVTNAGNYSVIITNNFGAVTSAIAVLTVVTNPVITSQPVNYTARIGDTATFNVTAIGAATLKYQWRLNTNTVIAGATSATLTLNNVQTTDAGTYTVIVTNKFGAVTSSPAILTVLLPPTITLTSPLDGQMFPAYPTNIALTAIAGDPNGVVTNVSFYSGTTLLGSLAHGPYIFFWTNTPMGVYRISAVAADDSGLTTTSSVANIFVDVSPTVAISTPTNGTVINASSNLTISASASDADGSVTQLQIYAGTLLLGTSATSPYSLVWSNVPTGTWNLTAVAFDNYGIGTTSSIVSITVSGYLITRPCVTDSFVRDGSFANTNFGTFTNLEVETVSGSGTNRDAYFTFSITNLNGNIGSAKLGLFASLGSPGIVTNVLYVVVTNWLETSITWSNRPPLVAAEFTNYVTSTNAGWYQYDITELIKSKVNTGKSLVSLALHCPGTNGILTTINSRENATNNPYLLVFQVNPPPTISFITPTNNATLTVYSNWVSVAASGSNGISEVDFYQSNTLFATDYLPPYNAYWNNSATGTFTLSAIAIDTAGLTATSSISVIVPYVDSDADGLPDWFETSISLTDPNQTDTDGNGISDGNEYFDATGLTWLQYYQLTYSPQTVSNPVISPAVGYAARAVSFTCNTPGATIYYTTNGLNPTTSSPYLYSGQAIWISLPTTVKAIAGKAGMISSGIQTNVCMVGKVVEGAQGKMHALKNDGTVWSWGNADWGTLGNGNHGCTGLSPQTSPIQVQLSGGGYLTNIIDIAAGDNHVVALQDDGTVWVWGSFRYTIFDCSATDYYPAKVTIPAGAKVIQVASGPIHAIILRADGTVWHWKYSNTLTKISLASGGPPLTNVTSIAGGEQTDQSTSFTIALKSDGTIWSCIYTFGASQIVNTPQTDVPIVSIATPNQYTFCLRSDGAAFDFINGNTGGAGGQFEYETDVNQIETNIVECSGGNVGVKVFPYDWFALTRKSDGSIWTSVQTNAYSIYGPGTSYTNFYGNKLGRWIAQSNAFFGGQTVVQTVAAQENCLVLTQDGSIWMWGDNANGQFGNGTSGGSSSTPTLVGLNLLTNIVQNTNDSTGDGIPDWQKLLLGFSTNNAYSNGDGLWDSISMTVGVNPFSTDVDGEGLLNTNEISIGTDPFNPDTDGDGVNDFMDAFPLDPTRWASPALNPFFPLVNLIVPINAAAY